MATYGSYKQIKTDQLTNGSVSTANLCLSAGLGNCTTWVFNNRGMCCNSCAQFGCNEQTNGCCCLWTVPSNVSCVTFEIWSGGGGGAGMICCNYCGFSWGGAGGNYAIKTVSVCPGWQYTVCAGGTWPCNQSHTCGAGMGCASYVQGCGLSNFCATGGCGGYMCDGDAWGGPSGYHHMGCAGCAVMGFCGADFGVMGTQGTRFGQTMCRCNGVTNWSGQAPFMGKIQVTSSSETWCTCACWTNWPSGGGNSGISSYCGDHAKQCAGGGPGGSGIVKITMS